MAQKSLPFFFFHWGGVKTKVQVGSILQLKWINIFNHNNFNLLTFTWVLLSLLTKDDYKDETEFTFIVSVS